MGRPTWGTEEQVAYLESFVGGLDVAKATCTLETEYMRISKLFIEKWPTMPSEAERVLAKDHEELRVLADDRRRKVSRLILALLRTWVDSVCQQIREWYKTRRKTGTHAQPKELLDLTGKTTRKPIPYQLHHAYSIRYYRDPNSPLRKEVDDLWDRREDKEVIEQLATFTKSDDLSSDNRLSFHNAVMRWKCSLLTEEELQELEEWITNSLAEKEEAISKPWKAGQDEGELSAENEYIQR